MKIKHEKMVTELFDIIDKILFMGKRDSYTIDGIKLHPSEIHLVLFIAEKQNINATSIAARLGITKGAVSQTLGRLERKGILLKEKDPYNKNELIITLTDFGNKVVRKYRNVKHIAELKFDKCFSQFNSSERIVIEKFMKHLKEVMIKAE